MKKRFRDTEVWKWIRTLMEIAGIALLVMAVLYACRMFGIANGVADGIGGAA